MTNDKLLSAFHPSSLALALYRGLKKLNPFLLWRSPVMFITEICAILTTLDAIFGHQTIDPFHVHITTWLWITLIFANTAESLAEIRSESWTSALRQVRSETLACRYDKDGNLNVVSYNELKKGDLILIRLGETIPADGEIISGSASIDESAITGEAQIVVRKAHSTTCNVTAGTKIISDEIIVRVSANSGEGFIDQMIRQVGGAKRKKTLNEIALTILLSSLTVIFLVMVVSNQLFARYYHLQLNYTMQIAFLTCLIPTTIASLMNAVGIAGINRLMKKNVIAMSGQTVEIAGNIDILLLDKTGTITVGEREAVAMTPSFDVSEEEFMNACYLCSFLDDTKEGRSILSYVKERFPFVFVRPRINFDFIPFNVKYRLSGIDLEEQQYRKGSLDAIEQFLERKIPNDTMRIVSQISEDGDTPLIVADKIHVLGVIRLRDKIKPGLTSWFQEFKKLGIKTVIVTGDNPITAAAVAKKVGADEFIASASPEEKLHYIRQQQMEGNIIAMTGDGLNDVPALTQADLSIAMNNGAQTAKEAANMIDLDSNPAKLFEIIQVGRQMLMTRGALTAFSIANDLAKFFIIIPAVLYVSIPDYNIFNIFNLTSPRTAVLSAVIFNTLSLLALIPLALKGVKLPPHNSKWVLTKNMLVYGLGGLILPVIGIKLIDMILTHLSING